MYKEALADFDQSLKLSHSQRDVYICWLYLKSQLDSAQPNELYKAITDQAVFPCQEVVFTSMVLHIKAIVSAKLDKSIDCIEAGESALKRMLKIPTFFAERIKLLELVHEAYQKLERTHDWTFKSVADEKSVATAAAGTASAAQSSSGAAIASKPNEVRVKILDKPLTRSELTTRINDIATEIRSLKQQCGLLKPLHPQRYTI